VNITYRPIDTWPGTLRTDAQRTAAQFTASWRDTLTILGRELQMLRAQHVVAQLAITERECRLDGQIRADARPGHPGVILAFDSKHGPLKYATDIYNRGAWRREGHLPGWQCNVRAIALGLEALRKVDRYGITKRGEQYTGWKALGSGIAMPAANGHGFATIEDAIAFVHDNAPGVEWDYDKPEDVERAFRAAAKRLHPGAGGDPELFKRLGEARRMLVGER
jgi:hypothetical protein